MSSNQQALLMAGSSSGSPPVQVCTPDPDISKVLLYLRGNGTNGSTTFTDSSAYGRTVTIGAGTPTISTAQKKFGTGSIFGGSGASQLLFFRAGAEWAQDNWTWQTFYRRAADSSYHGLFYHDQNLIIRLRTPVDSGTYQLMLVLDSFSLLVSTTSVALNTWTHLAVSVAKVSTTYTVRLFVNGVLEATTTSSNTNLSLRTASANASIGRADSGGFAGFNGYLDEYRITGATSYTASFTPPEYTFCLPGEPPFTGSVSGTEYPDSQTLELAQGTLRVLNPWVKLVGSAVASAAGVVTAIQPNIAVALTGISVGTAQAAFSVETSNRTAALSGQGVAVTRGALAVAPYPNLISSITGLPSTTSAPAATITVGTDGVVSFARDGSFTETTNWMIATSAFTPAQVSDKYQVVSVTVFSGSFSTLPALPFTLSSSFVAITNGAAEIQVNVAPVATNPRYGEAGYFSTIRVSIPPSDTT